MKSLSAQNLVAPAEGNKTLKSLVNRLVTGLVPSTVRNSSFIINDVPEGLKIVADTGIVANVLSSLFSIVTAHSTGSCMRITAKSYNDEILVQVRSHSINGSTLAYNLQATQPIAEKIGGCLGVTSQWKNETVIVFSFSNLAIAA